MADWSSGARDRLEAAGLTKAQMKVALREVSLAFRLGRRTSTRGYRPEGCKLSAKARAKLMGPYSEARALKFGGRA